MHWLLACSRTFEIPITCFSLLPGFRILLVVMPMFPALEEDAPRTQWAREDREKKLRNRLALPRLFSKATR